MHLVEISIFSLNHVIVRLKNLEEIQNVNAIGVKTKLKRIETQNNRIETRNNRIETQNNRIETRNYRIEPQIIELKLELKKKVPNKKGK